MENIEQKLLEICLQNKELYELIENGLEEMHFLLMAVLLVMLLNFAMSCFRTWRSNILKGI